MLLLRFLAILGHQFEYVSHFTIRYAGSESDPEVCGSLELLVIWPVQSLLFLAP